MGGLVWTLIVGSNDDVLNVCDRLIIIRNHSDIRVVNKKLHKYSLHIHILNKLIEKLYYLLSKSSVDINLWHLPANILIFIYVDYELWMTSVSECLLWSWSTQVSRWSSGGCGQHSSTGLHWSLKYLIFIVSANSGVNRSNQIIMTATTHLIYRLS